MGKADIIKGGWNLITRGGDDAVDAGRAARGADEAAEVGKSAGGKVLGGAGKVGGAMLDHPIRTAKGAIIAGGAAVFGDDIYKMAKWANGAWDAFTGPFTDKNGNLNGLGVAGLGAAAIGGGMMVAKKIAGPEQPELQPMAMQQMAMGGMQPTMMPMQQMPAMMPMQQPEQDNGIPFIPGI